VETKSSNWGELGSVLIKSTTLFLPVKDDPTSRLGCLFLIDKLKKFLSTCEQYRDFQTYPRYHYVQLS
jgi:hypothetical protein